jgi:N-carbamoylputrescine amidase
MVVLFTAMTAAPTTITLALVQMRMVPDPEANLRTAVARVREAAGAGATLVCLPELFRTLYIGQREDPALFDLAEPVPGPSTAALGAVARETGVVIIAPLFERRAAGLYHNTAAVIDADGTVVGIYRKMHVPDDPSYYEKFYFAPGDLGFRAFDTRAGRVGTLVCWDQWYPEAARLTALQGAVVLCYPTAIGWHPAEKARHGAAQLDAWRTVQRGHAIANGCYVAAVNRVGLERLDDQAAGIEFWGGSFVADPFGAVVAEAPTDREALLVAQLDLGRVEEVRRNWPFLRDRRTDAYGGIGSRFLDESVSSPSSVISRQPSPTGKRNPDG